MNAMVTFPAEGFPPFAEFGQVAPEFDNVVVTVDVSSKWQHLEPSSCPGGEVVRDMFVTCS